MPEAQVKSYVRNGRVVRGYRRRTKGGVNPDPVGEAKRRARESTAPGEAVVRSAVRSAERNARNAVSGAAKKADTTKRASGGIVRTAVSAANPIKATTRGISAKGGAVRTADLPSRRIAKPVLTAKGASAKVDRGLAALDLAIKTGSPLTGDGARAVGKAAWAIADSSTTPSAVATNLKVIGQLMGAAKRAGASQYILDQIASAQYLLQREAKKQTAARVASRGAKKASSAATKRGSAAVGVRDATRAASKAAKPKPGIATTTRRRVKQASDFVSDLFD